MKLVKCNGVSMTTEILLCCEPLACNVYRSHLCDLERNAIFCMYVTSIWEHSGTVVQREICLELDDVAYQLAHSLLR